MSRHSPEGQPRLTQAELQAKQAELVRLMEQLDQDPELKKKIEQARRRAMQVGDLHVPFDI